MVINFQNSKIFFFYIVDNFKIDIVTKFGGEKNTGSMLKFGLNLSAFLVSIFREILIIQTHKDARSELVS